jgi:hypothetical protein
MPIVRINHYLEDQKIWLHGDKVVNYKVWIKLVVKYSKLVLIIMTQICVFVDSVTAQDICVSLGMLNQI